MPSVSNLVLMTELDAVNAMLSAIGEAPIADVDTATQADVIIAINELRNATREVQAMGWRFNTEYGFQLPPAATLSWPDADGVTTLLNIFVPPDAPAMLDFSVTQIPEQQGDGYVDTAIRPSRVYTVSAAKVLVFYDRALNRDGFDASKYPFLYINPVWCFDYEQMPEVARRFTAILAGRRFQQRVVGSGELDGFTTHDESIALRNLKRKEGQEDDYNIFDNYSVSRVLGNRPILSGVSDRRKSPGPV